MFSLFFRSVNVCSCESEMLFTETPLKVHFILYKGEVPLKKKNKIRWNFFSVGEIKEMLKCIKDNGMQTI